MDVRVRYGDFNSGMQTGNIHGPVTVNYDAPGRIPLIHHDSLDGH